MRTLGWMMCLLALGCGGEGSPARVQPEPAEMPAAASAPAAEDDTTAADPTAGDTAAGDTAEGATAAAEGEVEPQAGTGGSARAPAAAPASPGDGTAAGASVPAPSAPQAPSALTDSERVDRFRAVVQRVVRMPSDRELQRRARASGVRFVSLTWEDTGRSWGSSGGPNISDLTLEVIDRFGPRPRTRLLPVLRYPNFSDRTADVPADRIRIRVGNEREGGDLQTLELREVLARLRAHLSFPDRFRAASDDFTAPRDTHYLVSAQHVFVPVPDGESVELAPVLFNYQSEPGTPAVLCLLVTREGTSIQIIENRYDRTLPNGWGQRLYFNHAGQRTVMTAERQSDVAARVEAGAARPEDATALEEGADMVMIVQVPLRLPQMARRSMVSGGAGSGYGSGAGGMADLGGLGGGGSDVETAVIGHGLDEGPFEELRRARIRRDPRFPIRITIQFYKATSNGIVGDADLEQAVAQIQRVYSDADYVGSLVVGSLGRPTAMSPR